MSPAVVNKKTKTPITRRKALVLGAGIIVFISVLVFYFLQFNIKSEDEEVSWNKAAWQSSQGITSEEAGITYESIDNPQSLVSIPDNKKQDLGIEFRAWCETQGYGAYPKLDPRTEHVEDDGTIKILISASQDTDTGIKDYSVWAIYHPDDESFTFEKVGD